jgi:hypothetical protein
VRLGTLFKTDCDYRGILGIQSREALRAHAWERSLADVFTTDALGAEWLVSGTTFEHDDKVDFTLSEAGLTLYFPPYQVACFALGSWEVTLPYYNLREILPPNLQLLIAASETGPRAVHRSNHEPVYKKTTSSY